MKYRLMDVLACPIDRTFPLQLVVFHKGKSTLNSRVIRKPVCEEYCGLRQEKTSKLDLKQLARVCSKCLSTEIIEGVLICPTCSRWYPIIEEIPHMLPDKLRKKNEDKYFLEKYQDSMPKLILSKGKPFNLLHACKSEIILTRSVS